MGNASKFEELLRSDETLQEKLRTAAEAYDGDVNNERAVFEAVVAPLAEEAGLPFTYEEAKQAAAESERISLDDLDAVAGGGFCLGIGGGHKTAAKAGDGSFGAQTCIGHGWGIFYID